MEVATFLDRATAASDVRTALLEKTTNSGITALQKNLDVLYIAGIRLTYTLKLALSTKMSHHAHASKNHDEWCSLCWPRTEEDDDNENEGTGLADIEFDTNNCAIRSIMPSNEEENTQFDEAWFGCVFVESWVISFNAASSSPASLKDTCKAFIAYHKEHPDYASEFQDPMKVAMTVHEGLLALIDPIPRAHQGLTKEKVEFLAPEDLRKKNRNQNLRDAIPKIGGLIVTKMLSDPVWQGWRGKFMKSYGANVIYSEEICTLEQKLKQCLKNGAPFDMQTLQPILTSFLGTYNTWFEAFEPDGTSALSDLDESMAALLKAIWESLVSSAELNDGSSDFSALIEHATLIDNVFALLHSAATVSDNTRQSIKEMLLKWGETHRNNAVALAMSSFSATPTTATLTELMNRLLSVAEDNVSNTFFSVESNVEAVLNAIELTWSLCSGGGIAFQDEKTQLLEGSLDGMLLYDFWMNIQAMPAL